MKHKRSIISLALATIMLVSICAVCTSMTTAEDRKSEPIAQTPPVVGGPVIYGPTVSIQPDGSIDRFVVNSAGVYHQHANGGWNKIGGPAYSAVAAASQANGWIWVFTLTASRDIYWTKTTDNGRTWANWQNTGQTENVLAGTAPAVSKFFAGVVLSWVNATTKTLMFKGFNGGTWYDRYDLGGICTSTPGVATTASLGPGLYTLHVFARGNDGALWYRTSTNNGNFWGSWTYAGEQLYPTGSTGYGPAVTGRGSINGVFDVFWIDNARALWHKQWDPATKTFVARQNLGGTCTATPTAIYNPTVPKYVYAEVRGGNNLMYGKTAVVNGDASPATTFIGWLGPYQGP